MVVHDAIPIPSLIKSKSSINIQTIKTYKSNLSTHPLHSESDSDQESLTDCDSFSSISSESPVVVIQSSPTTDLTLCSVSSQSLPSSYMATASLRNSLSVPSSTVSITPTTSPSSTPSSSSLLSASLLSLFSRKSSSSAPKCGDNVVCPSDTPPSSIETSSLASSSSYFSVTPRMTDDHVPSVEIVPQEKELTTFSISLPDQEHLDANIPHFRNRDSRINSTFLRLYALDYHARSISKTLPNDEEELYDCIVRNPQLHNFHANFDLEYISGCSKNKLWSQVILPPRSDSCPAQSIDSCQYICLEQSPDQEADGVQMTESSSLIRQSGECLPWQVLVPCLKPAGVLPMGKVLCNGLSPSSGVTKCQYTMKGWVNKRWVPQTIE